jgi:LuxR family maltose regulon positive regulatory protein
LRDYSNYLLSQFDAKPHQITATQERISPIGDLVEPLTLRELEVLKLICVGDSNQAIANKLVISIKTVKKHTGNILGKLGVTSRAQAMVKARQSGLLPLEK